MLSQSNEIKNPKIASINDIPDAVLTSSEMLLIGLQSMAPLSDGVVSTITSLPTSTLKKKYKPDDMKQALLDSLEVVINEEGKTVPRWTHPAIISRNGVCERSYFEKLGEFRSPEVSFNLDRMQFLPRGRPRKFSEEDEIVFAEWVERRNKALMVVSKREFINAVASCWLVRYKASHGGALPPKDKIWVPGKDWFDSWSQRMQALGYNVGLSRLKAVNAQSPTRKQVDSWFKKFSEALVELKLADLPQDQLKELIINIDETAADYIDPSNIRVIGKPNGYTKFPIEPGDHDHITMVGIIDAAGNRFPPFIILKGKRAALNLQNCEERMSGTPPNTGWACSDSGWITNDIWATLLMVVWAIKNPSRAKPLIILVDCHSTRFDLATAEWAAQHHCHIMPLLPNATSIMQPLDAGFFAPVKKRIQELFNEHVQKGGLITKTTAPKLMIQGYIEKGTREVIQSSWARCNMGTFSDHMSTHGMPSDLFRPELKVSHDGKQMITHHNDNELKLPPKEFSQYLQMKARQRNVSNRGTKKVHEAIGMGLITTSNGLAALKQWEDEKQKKEMEKQKKATDKAAAIASGVAVPKQKRKSKAVATSSSSSSSSSKDDPPNKRRKGPPKRTENDNEDDNGDDSDVVDIDADGEELVRTIQSSSAESLLAAVTEVLAKQQAKAAARTVQVPSISSSSPLSSSSFSSSSSSSSSAVAVAAKKAAPRVASGGVFKRSSIKIPPPPIRTPKPKSVSSSSAVKEAMALADQCGAQIWSQRYQF